MTPIDIIVIVIIALVVGFAAFYIYKAKKAGKKCIGCPDSATCGKNTSEGGCSGSCSSCGCNCGHNK